MLSNTIFSQILQAIITAKEPLLQARLEGGLSPIRNNEFTSDNYKEEELIEPSDGIYDVQKRVDEWIRANPFPPGADQDRVKKILWKKFAEEMSTQISLQVTNWLRDDVMLEFATAINNEIKKADITITVPPTSILTAVPITPVTPTGTVPTVTGTPIPPTNVIIT
jgi:hypothetical protein